MLAGHIAYPAAPGFVGKLLPIRAGGLQGLSPFEDDPPLLPVGRADQLLPSAQVCQGSFVSRRNLQSAFLLHR